MMHYEGARAPWSPWRYRRGLGEVARVVGLMLLYYATRGLAVGREDAALDHARAVIALEQRLGIYREPAFNAWVTLHPLVRDALNLGYTYLHLPVLAGFGFWLYWRRPGQYPAIRNTVFISAAAALLVYTLFPVAPPRLAGLGFIDMVSQQPGVGLTGRSTIFYNPLAAVPSLHVGFAAAVSLALAVVATGNHYVFDIAVGLAVTALGFAAGRATARGRGSGTAPAVGRRAQLVQESVIASPSPS